MYAIPPSVFNMFLDGKSTYSLPRIFSNPVIGKVSSVLR